jgi:general secretion pathway protein G
MKKAVFKKRFITLVEMMIVMFLIAMITGVIAYNYTGSLEEGKAFKTRNAMTKIQNVLSMHLATKPEDLENVETQWKGYIKLSPLVKSARDLEKDGWGGDYKVTTDTETGEIIIISDKYDNYLKGKKGTMFDNKG